MFFSVVHLAVHMHTINLLKNWLTKKKNLEINAFIIFFVPKTKYTEVGKKTHQDFISFFFSQNHQIETNFLLAPESLFILASSIKFS